MAPSMAKLLLGGAVAMHSADAQQVCSAGNPMLDMVTRISPQCFATDSCSSLCNPISDLITDYMRHHSKRRVIDIICENPEPFNCMYEAANSGSCNPILLAASGMGLDIPMSLLDFTSHCAKAKNGDYGGLMHAQVALPDVQAVETQSEHVCPGGHMMLGMVTRISPQCFTEDRCSVMCSPIGGLISNYMRHHSTQKVASLVCSNPEPFRCMYKAGNNAQCSPILTAAAHMGLDIPMTEAAFDQQCLTGGNLRGQVAVQSLVASTSQHVCPGGHAMVGMVTRISPQCFTEDKCSVMCSPIGGLISNYMRHHSTSKVVKLICSNPEPFRCMYKAGNSAQCSPILTAAAHMGLDIPMTEAAFQQQCHAEGHLMSQVAVRESSQLVEVKSQHVCPGGHAMLGMVTRISPQCFTEDKCSVMCSPIGGLISEYMHHHSTSNVLHLVCSNPEPFRCMYQAGNNAQCSPILTAAAHMGLDIPMTESAFDHQCNAGGNLKSQVAVQASQLVAANSQHVCPGGHVMLGMVTRISPQCFADDKCSVMCSPIGGLISNYMRHHSTSEVVKLVCSNPEPFRCMYKAGNTAPCSPILTAAAHMGLDIPMTEAAFNKQCHGARRLESEVAAESSDVVSMTSQHVCPGGHAMLGMVTRISPQCFTEDKCSVMCSPIGGLISDYMRHHSTDKVVKLVCSNPEPFRCMYKAANSAQCSPILSAAAHMGLDIPMTEAAFHQQCHGGAQLKGKAAVEGMQPVAAQSQPVCPGGHMMLGMVTRISPQCFTDDRCSVMCSPIGGLISDYMRHHSTSKVLKLVCSNPEPFRCMYEAGNSAQCSPILTAAAHMGLDIPMTEAAFNQKCHEGAQLKSQVVVKGSQHVAATAQHVCPGGHAMLGMVTSIAPQCFTDDKCSVMCSPIGGLISNYMRHHSTSKVVDFICANPEPFRCMYQAGNSAPCSPILTAAAHMGMDIPMTEAAFNSQCSDQGTLKSKVAISGEQQAQIASTQVCPGGHAMLGMVTRISPQCFAEGRCSNLCTPIGNLISDYLVHHSQDRVLDLICGAPAPFQCMFQAANSGQCSPILAAGNNLGLDMPTNQAEFASKCAERLAGGGRRLADDLVV